ncbi:hypothetical protein BD309DRAFT_850659 [Dichomitus squalens]|uniref:Molybdopterin synthase sulfur carrier subunit n=1 Tax=Dichomitus squalens TaxID=114155 RepID=A0A4Q9P5W1_9APHY|nr:hypothetical protein BD311DRAFT_714213 [Dichomitus squalens]TBU49849.1 hypothetical protein BD309DRAFT_850659 [Dichomitus squalens]TBU63080.1 hypothetical protein BD310DRAFT_809874 [Dichomitus squalens]
MAALRTPSITVLYFAAASTATGLTTEEVELPRAQGGEGASLPLTQLAALLTSRHPNTSLGSVLEESQWAVDAEMVEDPTQVTLRGGEEVAVICPVSGG